MALGASLRPNWVDGHCFTAKAATSESTTLRDALEREAALPCDPAWSPMLLYLPEPHW
jgi:hypothetical protein